MSIGRDFVFHHDEMEKFMGFLKVILPSNFVD
jgi:hypothetical protein